MRHHRRLSAALATIAACAMMMAGCSSNSGGSNEGSQGSDNGSSAQSSSGPIKLGVVGSSDPQWPKLEEKAKEAGIELKIINFTDYPSINPATSQGELDLNQFQHIKYLAAYNASVPESEQLVPIGATAIYPMGIYSREYKDVADIPEGGEITIPNDVTNQSRALLLLQDAGLIKLRADASALPDPSDVDKDASRVKVTPVDANNVVTAINSVSATVVNNDYLADAGLKASDALLLEDPKSEGAAPYINIWAARKDNFDNPDFAKLVQLFATDELREVIQENADGSALFSDAPREELIGILDEQIQLLKEAD